LLVLIGILALAVVAWYYDYSYAGPGSDTKYDAIQKMVDDTNAKGVKEGGVVDSKLVQEVVGFAPTYVQQEKDYTVEWYCWWGKIPVLTTWKRYITVVYEGEPRHFINHHKNEPPPAESLPGYMPPAPPPGADAGATPPEMTGAPAMPGMPAGGGGRGGKKGNGAEPGEGSGESTKTGEGDAAIPKSDTPPSEDAPKATDKPAESEKPAEGASPKADDAPKSDAPKADAPKADDKPAQ
jgi:hypothetical protein